MPSGTLACLVPVILFLNPQSSILNLNGPWSVAFGMSFGLWESSGAPLASGTPSGLWDWSLEFGSGIAFKGPGPPLPKWPADTKKHLQKQTLIFEPILPSQDPKVHPSCHLASFLDPKWPPKRQNSRFSENCDFASTLYRKPCFWGPGSSKIWPKIVQKCHLKLNCFKNLFFLPPRPHQMQKCRPKVKIGCQNGGGFRDQIIQNWSLAKRVVHFMPQGPKLMPKGPKNDSKWP